jgi:molecular chaperone GrpE
MKDDKTTDQNQESVEEYESENMDHVSEDNNPEETVVKEANLDYKDAYLRATADYQNLKKEVAQMQSQYVKFANEKMLGDLLPVIEHFHQGLKYVPKELQTENWMVGFHQIQKQLNDFMEKNGLERIETVGKQFDASLHEAMTSRSEEGKESGEILEEVMGGYKLNDKVIQAARVIVAE